MASKKPSSYPSGKLCQKLHHPGVVTTLGLNIGAIDLHSVRKTAALGRWNVLVQTRGRSATAGVSLVQQLTDGGIRGEDLLLLAKGIIVRIV